MSELQRFDAEEDCKRLIPAGSVQRKLRFQQVFVFEEYLDPFEFTDDSMPSDDADLPTDKLNNQVRIRFGIPLFIADTAYEQMTRPRVVTTALGEKIVVGEDRLILPHIDPDKLLKRNTTPPLVSISVDKLKQDSVSTEHGELLISKTTKANLLSNGTALLRKANGSGKVIVELESRSVVVDDLESVLANKSIEMNGIAKSISIHSKLARRGNRVFATTEDNEFVELRRQPQFFTNPITAVNTAMAELLKSAFKKKCDMVRAFRADPRSRRDHISTYGQHPIITSLNDRVFHYFLTSLRKTPEWTSCVPAVDNSPNSAPGELPQFEIGVMTSVEQNWSLQGYSKGSLLSSITMAPSEEVSLEVFTFERHKLENEQSFSSEFEKNQQTNNMSRATANITQDVAQSMDASVGVNGSVSFPVKAVKVQIGGSADVSGSLEQSTNLTAERVNEATVTASERFKSTHQVKIVQTTASGEEKRSIRKFQNPNQGRTLTLHHFEIQEHHHVVTKTTNQREYVVLIENPSLGAFDLDFVLANEDILQEVLRSSVYHAGFAAARKLAANRWLEEEDAREKARQAEVLALKLAERRSEQLAAEETATAQAEIDAQEARRKNFPNTGIFATARQIVDALDKFDELPPLEELFKDVLDYLNPFTPPPTVNEVKKLDSNLSRHSFYFRLTMAYPGFEEAAKDFALNIKNELQSPDEETRNEVINATAVLIRILDDDIMFGIKTVVLPYVYAAMISATKYTAFTVPITSYLIKTIILPDDLGLPQLLTKARKEVSAQEAMQMVNTMTDETAPPATAPEPITSDTLASIPVETTPRVYPVNELAEAHADFKKLQLHLEQNRNYYTNEVWKLEDPDIRFFRLSQMGVARFVENRLLGFAGTKAMYPLSLEALPEEFVSKLKTMYSPAGDAAIKETTEEIVLPTVGVHLEAVVGQCDAIEPYLVERREIDKLSRAAQASLLEQQVQIEQQEVNRLELRLSQNPPILDYPFSESENTDTPASGNGQQPSGGNDPT